jgi:hypothetical protein
MVAIVAFLAEAKAALTKVRNWQKQLQQIICCGNF